MIAAVILVVVGLMPNGSMNMITYPFPDVDKCIATGQDVAAKVTAKTNLPTSYRCHRPIRSDILTVFAVSDGHAIQIVTIESPTQEACVASGERMIGEHDPRLHLIRTCFPIADISDPNFIPHWQLD